MARHKDANWNLSEPALTWEQAQIAVLMDIRDELKSINRLLNCYRIPRALDAISRIDRRLQNNGALVGSKRTGK